MKQETPNSKVSYDSFPGAPEWGSWLQGQHEAKKREVGRWRRLGRSVIDLAALGVIAAKAPSNAILFGAAGVAREQRGGRYAPLEQTARNHFRKVDQKRHEAHQRRVKEFRVLKQQTWDKYLEENPDIKERIIQERTEAKRRSEQAEITGVKRNVRNRANYIHDYLDQRRSVYSFSKAIPRRAGSSSNGEAFNSSYDELAKDTLAAAMKDASGDNILFFAPEILNKKIEHTAASRRELGKLSDEDNAYRYVDGVATTIWKLGFVNFDSEDDVLYGKGVFNSDIRWEQGENDMTMISIPYDNANELHQMLAAGQNSPEHSRVFLTLGTDSANPEFSLSLSLRQQPSIAQAA